MTYKRYKNGIFTQDCKELDLSYLEKDKTYFIIPVRDMAPIYTIPGKRNDFEKVQTIVNIIYNKELQNEDKYDNIIFNNFVLTNCTIMKLNRENEYSIISEKVTLI